MTSFEEIKMKLTIIPEYEDLMESIYTYVKDNAKEEDDVFMESGESRDGYLSRCCGAVGLRYFLDFSLYYFNGYSHLPNSDAKKDIASSVKRWRDELKEQSKETGETIEELEESFFDDGSKYGLAHLNVMIKEISSCDGLTLEEQEKYKDFDNVILISCYTTDQYGQYGRDICKEFLLPIKLISDKKKIWAKLKKEIDKRIALLFQYYDQR